MSKPIEFTAANGCPKCTAACLNMKEQGFRDWRDEFACFDHAAVNLTEWMAANGISEDMPVPAAGDQLDFFPIEVRR